MPIGKIIIRHGLQIGAWQGMDSCSRAGNFAENEPGSRQHPEGVCLSTNIVFSSILLAALTIIMTVKSVSHRIMASIYIAQESDCCSICTSRTMSMFCQTEDFARVMSLRDGFELDEFACLSIDDGVYYGWLPWLTHGFLNCRFDS